jgi:hypothetical protein
MFTGPLSIEKPMETAGTEAHVFVLATRLNGEFSVAPFAGLVTEIVEVAAAEGAATIVML